MRFRYWIYLIYLVALGVCPSCCCNKPPCPDFSAEEKSWMPYKENDTISFKSNLGNKINFIASAPNDAKNYENIRPKYGCPDYCVSGIQQRLSQTSNISRVPNFYHQINKREKKFDYYITQSNIASDIIFDKTKSIVESNMNIGGVIFPETYIYINDTLNSNIFYYKFFVVEGYGLIRFENRKKEYYERVF